MTFVPPASSSKTVMGEKPESNCHLLSLRTSDLSKVQFNQPNISLLDPLVDVAVFNSENPSWLEKEGGLHRLQTSVRREKAVDFLLSRTTIATA